MAQLLWGNVFYQNQLAGSLSEEASGDVLFTYDASYLSAQQPPIAHTLPLRSTPYRGKNGLPAFFDNLVAEGWLENVQTRSLGKRLASRFELLLAFGWDCAGAVSVIDPDFIASDTPWTPNDNKEMAAMASRASLSGIQPKLAVIQRNNRFEPSKNRELSTHIAKFPSQHHDDLVINEYLTTLAFRALLPNDSVVEMTIDSVQGFSEPALLIKRFDRADDDTRLPFEEFNQLFGLMSTQKYQGAYKDLSDFMQQTPGCLKTEIYRLFLRILAGFLLGNTDMHLKNFAMFHHPEGLRLTPVYDQVAAILYQYKTCALKIAGTENLSLSHVKPNHIIRLGLEFGLNKSAIQMAVHELQKNLEAAKEMVLNNPQCAITLKNSIINQMEKRWNGTFALIGQALSKKR